MCAANDPSKSFRDTLQKTREVTTRHITGTNDVTDDGQIITRLKLYTEEDI